MSIVVDNLTLCTRHWDIAAVFICICILGRLEVEVVVAWASADMLGPSVKVDDRTIGHSLSKVSGIPNLGRLAILQRDHAWIVLLATVIQYLQIPAGPILMCPLKMCVAM